MPEKFPMAAPEEAVPAAPEVDPAVKRERKEDELKKVQESLTSLMSLAKGSTSSGGELLERTKERFLALRAELGYDNTAYTSAPSESVPPKEEAPSVEVGVAEKMALLKKKEAEQRSLKDLWLKYGNLDFKSQERMNTILPAEIAALTQELARPLQEESLRQKERQLDELNMWAKHDKLTPEDRTNLKRLEEEIPALRKKFGI